MDTDRNGANPNVEMTGIDALRAIDLRWTLRDIKAKRTRMLPPPQDQVRDLIMMGLIEMVDDVPTITAAGHRALDR